MEKKQLQCILEDSKFDGGKYLRIKKGSRFICLPMKAINILIENISQISEAVKNGLPYSVKLSDAIDVEVTLFKGIAYVVFKKGTFYINAAFEEWRIVEESIPDSFFPRVCGFVYTPKDARVEIFQIICDGAFPKSFYTEEGAKSYASSLPGVCTVVKKTVTAPDGNSMVHNAKAYLMRNKLKNLLKEVCYGCQYDRPSQIEHSCLESLEDSVDKYYGKFEIGSDELKDFLNKVMDKLQMSSFRGFILDHKPDEGKVLAALKEDNMPEIWTELFNEICFA